MVKVSLSWLLEPRSYVKIMILCTKVKVLNKMWSFFLWNLVILDLQVGRSCGPSWPKTSFFGPRTLMWRFIMRFNRILFLSFLIIQDNMRPSLSKLGAGFLTCGLESLLGPVGPKLYIFWTMTPMWWRDNKTFDLTFLNKMMLCFCKLQLGLWIHGLR